MKWWMLVTLLALLAGINVYVSVFLAAFRPVIDITIPVLKQQISIGQPIGQPIDNPQKNSIVYNDMETAYRLAEHMIHLGYHHYREPPIHWDRWHEISNTTCLQSKPPPPSWQFRAPYVILIGTQKGGSTSLSKFLKTHPDFVRGDKEFHFLSSILDQGGRGVSQHGIDAALAREWYFPQNTSKVLPQLQANDRMKVLDATPMYMFQSDRIPARILCVCPWAKLLAVLRNPVDRAFSQYNMQLKQGLDKKLQDAGAASSYYGNSTFGFDRYIQHDLQLLRATGVVQDWTQVDFDEFSGSPRETEAWARYNRFGLSSPVGRGMYSIQLRGFIQAYIVEQSLDWKTQLLVVQSEELKTNTTEVFGRVLDFLQLAQPSKLKAVHAKRGTYSSPPMSNTTRQLLTDFFEPYNRQLASLLGPEWENVWTSS